MVSNPAKPIPLLLELEAFCFIVFYLPSARRPPVGGLECHVPLKWEVAFGNRFSLRVLLRGV